MKELQDRILKDGQVIGTNILKVNKFINHQVDPVLLSTSVRISQITLPIRESQRLSQ